MTRTHLIPTAGPPDPRALTSIRGLPGGSALCGEPVWGIPERLARWKMRRDPCAHGSNQPHRCQRPRQGRCFGSHLDMERAPRISNSTAKQITAPYPRSVSYPGEAALWLSRSGGGGAYRRGLLDDQSREAINSHNVHRHALCRDGIHLRKRTQVVVVIMAKTVLEQQVRKAGSRSSCRPTISWGSGWRILKATTLADLKPAGRSALRQGGLRCSGPGACSASERNFCDPHRGDGLPAGDEVFVVNISKYKVDNDPGFAEDEWPRRQTGT